MEPLVKIINQNNTHYVASFVAYRHPSEQNITVYSGKTTQQIVGEGFVFSPFLKVSSEQIFPQVFFSEQTCKKIIYPYTYQEDSNLTAAFSFLKNSDYSTLHFEDYQHNFEAAFLLLQEKKIDKIVLSHREKQALPENILTFFDQLLQNFPNAFVYLLYTPETGMWMGASPELLFEKRDNTLKTIALAGTQSQKNFKNWSPKEEKEQALVSDFIRAVLEKHKLTITAQTEPYTSQYGNMVHLKTDFTAEISSHFSELDFITDLHPTPAVGGLPQKKAVAFLQENEKHRAYYTGYLGEVSPAHTKLFVNLRCASLWADGLYLYAGGGVTAESTLEKEWAEIQLKLLNLKRFL